MWPAAIIATYGSKTSAGHAFNKVKPRICLGPAFFFFVERGFPLTEVILYTQYINYREVCPLSLTEIILYTQYINYL